MYHRYQLRAGPLCALPCFPGNVHVWHAEKVTAATDLINLMSALAAAVGFLTEHNAEKPGTGCAVNKQAHSSNGKRLCPKA